MLRNTMTNTLTLFCLVDGDSAPFPVEIESTKTVGSLKDSIKLKKTPRFDDVAADELTLWSVSIPVSDDDDDEAPLYIDNILETDKKKLKATTKLSKVFGAVPEDTIHIIVQRPGNAAFLVIQLCLHVSLPIVLTLSYFTSYSDTAPAPTLARDAALPRSRDVSRPCKFQRLGSLGFDESLFASADISPSLFQLRSHAHPIHLHSTERH